MKCSQEENLYRFHDGNLSSMEAAEFQNHLSQCPECQKELIDIQEHEHQFREIVFRVFPSGQLSELVMKRISRESPNFYPIVEKKFDWGSLLRFFVPSFAVILMALIFFKMPIGHEILVPRILLMAEVANQNSLLNGEPLPTDQKKVLSFEKSLEFAGNFEFSINEGITEKQVAINLTDFSSVKKIQRLLCKGRGKVIFSGNSLTWLEGDSEIEFQLSKKFFVRAGSAEFEITGTKVKFTGSSDSEISVTLLDGKVFWKTFDGSQSGMLLKGVPFNSKKNGKWCYNIPTTQSTSTGNTVSELNTLIGSPSQSSNLPDSSVKSPFGDTNVTPNSTNTPNSGKN
ncbi:MAG: zf-HC2 domain-containing protein [Candidatus Riflebacteria bacterium]|nr:zf-HC2 domain-containing protein [Candidatus Riflebacteria bacterium]